MYQWWIEREGTCSSYSGVGHHGLPPRLSHPDVMRNPLLSLTECSAVLVDLMKWSQRRPKFALPETRLSP